MREHAGTLLAYLHVAVADAHEVDDLFQETCVVAWRKLRTFDDRRPFGPWLRGIARNLVLTRRRSAARRWPPLTNTLGSAEALAARVEAQPGEVFEEKLAALRLCLEGLAPTHRDAVRATYFDGLSNDQAASRLALSAETMKKRLQRARALLRDCLSRRGLLPTEATP